MNIVLCLSSLFHGIIIFFSTKEKYIASIHNTHLVCITYASVISSICNHSTTNIYALWIDTTLFYLAFIFYLAKTIVHTEHIYNQRLVIQTASIYAFAKYHDYPIQTIFHVFTHINATYTYWRILVIEEKRIRQVQY